jgi:hypothetical protein
VPAVCVAMVSSKTPYANWVDVSAAKATVSSPFEATPTVSAVCGWVVLPLASFKVTVTVPTAPTNTVWVAGVSVMLVGAPAVVKEKPTVSVPL